MLRWVNKSANGVHFNDKATVLSSLKALAYCTTDYNEYAYMHNNEHIESKFAEESFAISLETIQ